MVSLSDPEMGPTCQQSLRGGIGRMWVKAGHQTMGLENTVRVPVGGLGQWTAEGASRAFPDQRAQIPCQSLPQPFSTLPIPPKLGEGRVYLQELYLHY